MTSFILHVDDDPNGLLMVKRAVQMADSDAEVVSANHGAEAIDYLSGT